MKQKTFDHRSNLNYPQQLEHSEVDIDRLKELYDQGRLKDVISIGESPTERYPNVLAFFEINVSFFLISIISI